MSLEHKFEDILEAKVFNFDNNLSNLLKSTIYNHQIINLICSILNLLLNSKFTLRIQNKRNFLRT